jgi:redox-sensitive bicupin YhaK (pirin superfamily)
MSEAPHTYRSLVRIVRGHPTTEGAGVRLRRAIGSQELDHLDPFLLLDEFRSESSADYIAGFPDHPHRGFETVTYMLAGSMEHRDHLGHRGLLESGGVQWMTAGRGIVHSEMPRQEHGLMWGIQLWLNLKSDEKLCEPSYRDIPSAAIPEVELPSQHGKVRVIAGEYRGHHGAVSGVSVAPIYLDVTLAAHASEEFALPDGHSAFVYMLEGSAAVDAPEGNTRSLGKHDLGVLDGAGALRVWAAGLGTRLLVLAARPLQEPIARYGPFVMNTREEVMQAVADFQNGRFLSGGDLSPPNAPD